MLRCVLGLFAAVIVVFVWVADFLDSDVQIKNKELTRDELIEKVVRGYYTHFQNWDMHQVVSLYHTNFFENYLLVSNNNLNFFGDVKQIFDMIKLFVHTKQLF